MSRNLLSDQDLAYKLALAVSRYGGRAFYVGGTVRDRFLDRPSKDLDVEVHGIAQDLLLTILGELGTPVSMGNAFPIYQIKGNSLDISLYPGPYDGSAELLRWACLRRDFTCNAMLWDILTDEILDPFDGYGDLKSGFLKHVDDATFCQDPLRVLRGPQLAARFGLSVSPETIALCRRISLTGISRERIEAELKKALLYAQRPSLFFSILRDMNQLSVWFPELETLIGVPQPEQYHAEGDVWNHTMLVLDEAAKYRSCVNHPYWFMLSALVHDFGKSVCTQNVDGRIRALGHEESGIPLVRSFLSRFTSETKLIRYVLNMTGLHMKPNILASSHSSVKATNKLLDQSTDPMDLIYLALADDNGRISMTPTASSKDFLMERLDIYQSYMARPYVSGQDLIEAGFTPGESFSNALELAHKLRLSGIDKDSALKQVLGVLRKA